MSTLTRRRRRTEINIVPLLDVFIVLIFFFLMTMQFNDQNVLNITPPKVETAGENNATDDILIAVNTEGQFYFNNTPVSEEELLTSIRLASEVNKDQFVLVMADEDTALKHVTLIIDSCRNVGMDRVRMQTR